MANKGPTSFSQAKKLASDIHSSRQAKRGGSPALETSFDNEDKMHDTSVKESTIKAKCDTEDQFQYKANHRFREWRKDGGPMDRIRDQYKVIQENISKLQGRTESILRDHEQDLLRAFTARMADVQSELSKEKKKNKSGSVEWVEKCHKLTTELEWLRDTAQKLTEENKNVSKELRRMKRVVKEKEKDREYLIKQLVSLKKENAKIHTSFDQMQASYSRPATAVSPALPRLEQSTRPFTSVSMGVNGGRTPSGLGGEFFRQSTPNSANNSARRNQMGSPARSVHDITHQEKRYRNVIARLKRQLESEQTKLKKAKAMYYSEVNSKNELQNFVKRCIQEVRLQANFNKEGLGEEVGFTREDVEDFDEAKRRTVLEKLMSNDRVIYLLYDRMFPSKSSQGLSVEQALEELDIESSKQAEIETEESRPISDWIDSKFAPASVNNGRMMSSSYKRSNRLAKRRHQSTRHGRR